MFFYEASQHKGVLYLDQRNPECLIYITSHVTHISLLNVDQFTLSL